MNQFNRYSLTDKELRFRAKEIMADASEAATDKKLLNSLLGLIDLTSLEGADTEIKIFSMCEYARSLPELQAGLNRVAAVCFYAPFVPVAHKFLSDSGIKVATVAGGFPSGQAPLHIKLAEIEYAVEQEADEIDVVISRKHILMNKSEELLGEITKMKQVCRDKKMKVILETGELEQVDKIRTASETAISAGADFLKTSTGKINPAATPEAFLIMLDTIKEYHEKTGRMIGVKPAGGIATPEDAAGYFLMVKHVLGDRWLTKDLFRIGASRLATKLVEVIKGD
jgi:deoxyribose-phosphate aldolase